MVEFLIEQCQDLHIFLNFLNHVILFLILGYLVFYKESFCKLHATIIWYTSLSSLFVAVTILIEWIFGNNHPMSYNKINVLSDTVFFINLILFFFIVVKHKKFFEKQLERLSRVR